MTFQDMMKLARRTDASDLILVVAKPPCVYVHGQLRPLELPPLQADELDRMIRSFLTESQQRRLDEAGDVDFSWGQQDMARARINVHKQRGSLAAAVRFIESRVPTFEELHLPPKLCELAQLARGLVLVTGNTGSGKSTTLAAMIGYINDHFAKHVITLEDPIEYLFPHQNCVIEQREIEHDSPSFADALRHVVRQKPDVILVGEMRDRETIATALTASETGHLVLGTLHTNSAAQTIERVIDVFDAAHQPQIRIQLANTLRAVVCQMLLRRDDQTGLIPAVEIMTVTSAIRRAVRDNDTHLIPGMVETGMKFGMCTMDQALAELAGRGVVSVETALAGAGDTEKLQRLIGTGSIPGTRPAEGWPAAPLDRPIAVGTAEVEDPWA